MSINIEDLQPKSFEVTIKGQTTLCKPPRLSHIFILSKIGNLFQSPESASSTDVKQAEKDLDEVFGDLIPELKGVNLDMQSAIDLIEGIKRAIHRMHTTEIGTAYVYTFLVLGDIETVERDLEYTKIFKLTIQAVHRATGVIS